MAYAMALQDLLDGALQAGCVVNRCIAQVEIRTQFARNHVGRAGAGVDIGDLETGRLEIFVALVPDAGRQLGQRRRQAVHRVLGALRVGDMPLHAVHDQPARQ